MSETLDGLHLILDDPEIYSKLIIIVEVDDEFIKVSIEGKYKNYFIEKNSFSHIQYLEKIFIFGIKLKPLSKNESSKIYDVILRHHFNIEKIKGKEQYPADNYSSHINSDIFSNSKDMRKEYDISDYESKLLKKAIREIPKATPRKIKIFLYKYILFVQLYVSLERKNVTHELSKEIINKLQDSKYKVEDDTIETVSSLLSAF